MTYQLVNAKNPLAPEHKDSKDLEVLMKLYNLALNAGENYEYPARVVLAFICLKLNKETVITCYRNYSREQTSRYEQKQGSEVPLQFPELVMLSDEKKGIPLHLSSFFNEEECSKGMDTIIAEVECAVQWAFPPDEVIAEAKEKQPAPNKALNLLGTFTAGCCIQAHARSLGIHIAGEQGKRLKTPLEMFASISSQDTLEGSFFSFAVCSGKIVWDQPKHKQIITNQEYKKERYLTCDEIKKTFIENQLESKESVELVEKYQRYLELGYKLNTEYVPHLKTFSTKSIDPVLKALINVKTDFIKIAPYLATDDIELLSCGAALNNSWDMFDLVLEHYPKPIKCELKVPISGENVPIILLKATQNMPTSSLQYSAMKDRLVRLKLKEPDIFIPDETGQCALIHGITMPRLDPIFSLTKDESKEVKAPDEKQILFDKQVAKTIHQMYSKNKKHSFLANLVNLADTVWMVKVIKYTRDDWMYGHYLLLLAQKNKWQTMHTIIKELYIPDAKKIPDTLIHTPKLSLLHYAAKAGHHAQDELEKKALQDDAAQCVELLLPGLACYLSSVCEEKMTPLEASLVYGNTKTMEVFAKHSSIEIIVNCIIKVATENHKSLLFRSIIERHKKSLSDKKLEKSDEITQTVNYLISVEQWKLVQEFIEIVNQEVLWKAVALPRYGHEELNPLEKFYCKNQNPESISCIQSLAKNMMPLMPLISTHGKFDTLYLLVLNARHEFAEAIASHISIDSFIDNDNNTWPWFIRYFLPKHKMRIFSEIDLEHTLSLFKKLKEIFMINTSLLNEVFELACDLFKKHIIYHLNKNDFQKIHQCLDMLQYRYEFFLKEEMTWKRFFLPVEDPKDQYVNLTKFAECIDKLPRFWESNLISCYFSYFTNEVSCHYRTLLATKICPYVKPQDPIYQSKVNEFLKALEFDRMFFFLVLHPLLFNRISKLIEVSLESYKPVKLLIAEIATIIFIDAVKMKMYQFANQILDFMIKNRIEHFLFLLDKKPPRNNVFSVLSKCLPYTESRKEEHKLLIGRLVSYMSLKTPEALLKRSGVISDASDNVMHRITEYSSLALLIIDDLIQNQLDKPRDEKTVFNEYSLESKGSLPEMPLSGTENVRMFASTPTIRLDDQPRSRCLPRNCQTG